MTAEINYIDRIALAIGELEPGCDLELLRTYAVLALVKGETTTAEDVHDAWAAWRAGTKPDHPALVPFDELTPDVQAMDEPYVKAIHQVVVLVAWANERRRQRWGDR